jgi:hypothetical protein
MIGFGPSFTFSEILHIYRLVSIQFVNQSRVVCNLDNWTEKTVGDLKIDKN